MRSKVALTVFAVVLAAAFAGQVFAADAQDKSAAPAAPVVAAAPAAPAPVVQPQAAVAAPQPADNAASKESAIYGEVKVVNASLGTLIVQYYDYDSDEEKSSEIAVGPGTKFENAANLSGVKQGDWLDVSYVAAGGKNTATLISVEKEDIEDTQADAKADDTEPAQK